MEIEYKQKIILELGKNNIQYDETIINMLYGFIKILLKWNDKINLISERDEYHLIERHIVDSIKLFDVINLDKYKNIVDLGSGNGFPGIIIKIFHNNKNITLIEQRKKKASFLKQSIYELKLNSIKVYDKNANQFNISGIDLILARAFGDYKKIKKNMNLENYTGDIGVYEEGKITIYNK